MTYNPAGLRPGSSMHASDLGSWIYHLDKRAHLSIREGRGMEEVPAGEKMKIDNSRNL